MESRNVARTLVAVGLLFSPLGVSAQQAGSGIAGVVRDATGAVLPGVTVEASSPALIERVRTATTDGQGQYKIVDLLPGTYSVTFSLTGFSSVRRDGIELVTAFVATLNPEMKVGSVEETITVSGAAPSVDIHNVVQHRVLTREVFDALPTNKGIPSYGALTPGIVIPPNFQDVGGNKGEQSFRMVIHGGTQSEQRLLQDGMRYNSAEGTGRGFYINTANADEINIELGGGGAESELGGVQLNLIPKNGGNVFRTYLFSNYTDHDLQSDNLTDAIRARGLNSVNAVRRIWDLSGSFGGPIRKDKLWFFSQSRSWGGANTIAGDYENATQGSWLYTPAPDRPAVFDENNVTAGIRLTWQAAETHKINASLDVQDNHTYHQTLTASLAPEAAVHWKFYPNYLAQAAWQHQVGGRMLVEAGNTSLFFDWPNLREPGVTETTISVLEQSTNFRYGAAASGYGRRHAPQANQRASVSYVTGSHAFKTGVFLQEGRRLHDNGVNGDMSYRFNRGVPNQVTLWATPITFLERLNLNLGIYAQDQWTLRRLTLNYGVRFDSINSSVPEQHLPAGRFVPARDFDAVPDVPNWEDINPRVSGAYDLFGNSKTALKASIGRYVLGEFVGTARNNNPVQTSVNSATRTWTDRNNDFVPDCDFSNPATNLECGPLSNLNFGKLNITTTSAPDVLNGWGHRGYQWQTSVAVEHQLGSHVALNGGYFRTWYGNFTVTDNLDVTPADFSEFCITVPADPRLPAGGGNRVCGLYDVNQAKFGLEHNLIDFADKYGRMYQVYNGVDYAARIRLPRGAFLQVGGNTGRTTGALGSANAAIGTQRCFVVDSPQELQFCDIQQRFQTQIKVNGSYTWPGSIQTSAVWQNLPGVPISASYTATSAEIAPSLGRNLSAGAGSNVSVPLIEPYSLYEDRITQLDVRVAKAIRVGRARLQGLLDIYNIFNGSSILAINTTYGSAWLRPQEILGARLFKFGVQVDF